MRPTKKQRRGTSFRSFLWDLLTFERLLTGPVLHLIYWAGLAVISLIGFAVVGAAVGTALRDKTGLLLAPAFLVAGLAVVAALVLLWRGFCEFYVAVFRISEDLRALRQSSELKDSKSSTPSV